MSERILYDYWRSSAAYRVRIALNLKGLSYQSRPIHLVKDGGEQHSDAYQAINPAKLVPVLVEGDRRIYQSLAIIEYLDETYPHTRLIPPSGDERYWVKALALDIAADLHPINNLRVLQYLTSTLHVSEEQKQQWYRHWIEVAFEALESRISERRGCYCVGDEVTLVDVCLVPQVYNAQRFDLDMRRYPNIADVTLSLGKLAAFARARPECQADAPENG
ncbi:maleylacetoacetate isomerase [Vibrio scophthalmi]|uniref:maleylacetoacetate isomerase n=1 Tax=Vibrio scophthalmi TaxID=45658 RepID=UPI002FF3E185